MDIIVLQHLESNGQFFIAADNRAFQHQCKIVALAANHQEWAKDYNYDANTNEWLHKDAKHLEKSMVMSWFTDAEPVQTQTQAQAQTNNSFMKKLGLWKK